MRIIGCSLSPEGFVLDEENQFLVAQNIDKEGHLCVALTNLCTAIGPLLTVRRLLVQGNMYTPDSKILWTVSL
jgi:hypothetical protein